MSTVLTDSTAPTGQMFLPFSQADYVDTPEHGPAELGPENVMPANPVESTSDSKSVASERTPVCRISDDGEPRIARPVRVGTVMIKLLKRYGITDEEISQGLQDYAAKHQVATAS